MRLLKDSRKRKHGCDAKSFHLLDLERKMPLVRQAIQVVKGNTKDNSISDNDNRQAVGLTIYLLPEKIPRTLMRITRICTRTSEEMVCFSRG